MDQETAIQAYLDNYKNPQVHAILSKYIRNPEGRNRLAASMIHPVKLAVDYLSQTKKPLHEIDYPMKSRVTEYNWFLSTVTEEEQKADPYPELKALVDRLQALIDEREHPPA